MSDGYDWLRHVRAVLNDLVNYVYDEADGVDQRQFRHVKDSAKEWLELNANLTRAVEARSPDDVVQTLDGDFVLLDGTHTTAYRVTRVAQRRQEWFASVDETATRASAFDAGYRQGWDDRR